jgi:AcrR family transcriptional regulator
MADIGTAPKRRTREEARLETRAKLVDAAAEIFAERGFYGASVEEIAERAGYTRGAFYSNYSGKDDIFLAVYDRRMEMQIEEIGALLRQSSDPTEFLASIRGRRSEVPTTFAWMLLQNEFLLYAMRNPDVRPKFAERYRRVRKQYALAIQAVFDSIGVELPAPIDDMTVILNVLDEGVLPLHYLDPEGVRPGFFFDALTLLFESAVALAEKRAAS